MSIPKILHRIWLGSPQPEEFQAYEEKWKELHPDWDIRLWTLENLPSPLINQRVFDEARPTDPWRWRSDVLRLELLLQFGGVYVDTDIEPLRPIDPLLEDCEAFMGWSPNRGRQGQRLVTNATIASIPGHPFITALVQELPQRVRRLRGHRTGMVTGPWFVDEVRNKQDWPGLIIYPEHIFYPQSINARRAGVEIDLSESYTWHRWDTARKRDKARIRSASTGRRLPYQPTWQDGQTIGSSQRDAVSRYDAILPFIPQGSRVLDFGSHVGYFSHRLADEHDCRCIAIAPEARSTEHVVAYKQKVNATQLKSISEFFGECDVALALSILHHTRPWPTYLATLREIAPIVIVETPNPEEKLRSASNALLREIYDRVTKIGEVIHWTGGYNNPKLLRPTVVIRNG